MSTRKLTVVSAGLSRPSSTRLLADQLAAATGRALRDLGEQSTPEVIEVRDHARDLTNHLLTGFPSADLGHALDRVVAADGLIAVTPIFNASYSGLFKSFFDVVEPDALAGKPVLLAATGGTARHSLALEHALRPLFAYLRAVTVPTAVYAAAEDWGAGSSTTRGLAERVERAAGELAGLVAGLGTGLVNGQTRRSTADPFADPIPFEQLVAASTS
jgi:FMN reductase